MIKAVDIPDEFEEKPRLLGLLCENDAYPALDTAGPQAHPAQRVHPLHPGPLPGLGQRGLDRRRPVRAASTASCWWAAGPATTTSATSSGAAS